MKFSSLLWRIGAGGSRGKLSGKALFDLVRPYTMVDDLRLSSLENLTNEVCKAGVRGDIVECGVYNGGSAAIPASVIKPLGERCLWLYDTFEGIPAAGPLDGSLAVRHTGDFRGQVERVKEVFNKADFPLERIVFRKGLFQDTFKEPFPQKVALLHIDADWYESVLHALRTFYPRVSDGGVIILDDFGYWEGARRAFYAFCREFSVEPLLERVGYTQAFWLKGKEHNRNTQGEVG